MTNLLSNYSANDLEHLPIPMFQVLAEETRREFLNAFSLAHFSRYDYLFQPGQVARYGYLILKGAIRQYYLSDGKEVVTRLLLENDMCTSYHSFVTEKPSFEYAEAMEDVELIAISRFDFERLCEKNIDIANLERKVTEQYLVQEYERSILLQFCDAQERYQELMKTRPEVFLRFSIGSIASFLGMSQETLSRLRTKSTRSKNMI